MIISFRFVPFVRKKKEEGEEEREMDRKRNGRVIAEYMYVFVGPRVRGPSLSLRMVWT